MKSLYAWGAIAVIVLTSTAGDVLLSRGMKQVGDVGELRRRVGVLAVLARVLKNPNFLLGRFVYGDGVLQSAVRTFLGRSQSGGSGFDFSYVHHQCRRSQDLPA